MTSYPYIDSLFTAILNKSEAINGRFYISAKGGAELNSDEMGQVIEDRIKSHPAQKYPLCMAMNFRSQALTGKDRGWESYRPELYFLKRTYAQSNGEIANRNASTNTSTHTVVEDWHDMKRAAVMFTRALEQVITSRQLIGTIQPMQDGRYIDPVSFAGKDVVSGVRLVYPFRLWIGCELEDYSLDDLSGIVLPLLDPHPQHKL